MIVDDLSLVEVMANEVEEQAVKFRCESIEEGTISKDFPVPYLPWSEINDSLSEYSFFDMGHSTHGESDSEFALCFGHDERFGGRLKPFIDYLAPIVENGVQVFIVSRQSPRLLELWNEHYPKFRIREFGIYRGFTF